MKKTIPLVFIGILVLIITFFTGIRYGRHVESLNTENPVMQEEMNTNKEKETPSPVVTPLSPDLSFILYQNEPCEVEFLYPDILTPQEATNGATFVDTSSNEVLSLSCSDSEIVPSNQDESSLQEIVFQGNTQQVQVKNEANRTYYSFSYRHPEIDSSLVIVSTAQYLSLLDRTLSYELSQ